MQEQQKDFNLLRPFDLEKAKAGEALCDASTGNEYVFIGHSKTTNEIYVQIVNNNEDSIFECDAHDLRMKPLCWLEGKPVYKGDELWHKNPGMEKINYIVEEYETSGCITATEDSLGCLEHISLLSWNKQENNKDIPEVLHDPDKFKVGDKVRFVYSLSEIACSLSEGDYLNKGWYDDWVYFMDAHVGEEFIVKGSNDKGVNVGVGYYFPSSVMELVEAVKEKSTKLLEIYLDGELIKREYYLDGELIKQEYIEV
jgi:hypothetical protein